MTAAEPERNPGTAGVDGPANDAADVDGRAVSAADREKQVARAQRRTKLLGSILLAAAALAFWIASRLTWATVLAADGLSPARTFDVKGSDWSPWLTPLALVLLAAILAAMSLRGWGLRILALLVAAAGVLAAFPAISLVMGGTNDTYAATAAGLNDRYVVQLVTTHNWVAVVVLIGSLCAVAAGVLLMRVASGAGMSSKYKTPAARREDIEREIFAEHKRRQAAESAQTDKNAQAGKDARSANAASSEGSSPVQKGAAADTSAESGGSTGDQTDAPDAPNERMLWDALDTGIDPTDQR
ncbi:TIGR02234 family membrane protein [Gordonia sputi]|uniref:TIGR02234 family membrane protein n=1 Tax=Gordonia sputi TaxID=36823 RepID=UPI002044AA14|nr:TIGR02234 family membrane protein [Gordonia sputi]MCM3895617.1 TIGR02234 family membrane protein [Gordonia sputi]